MKSVYKAIDARPLLPADLLFVLEFIGFVISYKDISASQRFKCSLDSLYLLGNSVRNLVVAAVEVCLV